MKYIITLVDRVVEFTNECSGTIISHGSDYIRFYDLWSKYTFVRTMEDGTQLFGEFEGEYNTINYFKQTTLYEEVVKFEVAV